MKKHYVACKPIKIITKGEEGNLNKISTLTNQKALSLLASLHSAEKSLAGQWDRKTSIVLPVFDCMIWIQSVGQDVLNS